MSNIFVALKHIKASTVEDLENKMLRVNLNSQKEIKFHFIQHVKDEWFAFYYVNRKNETHEKLSEALNEI